MWKQILQFLTSLFLITRHSREYVRYCIVSKRSTFCSVFISKSFVHRILRCNVNGWCKRLKLVRFQTKACPCQRALVPGDLVFGLTWEHSQREWCQRGFYFDFRTHTFLVKILLSLSRSVSRIVTYLFSTI